MLLVHYCSYYRLSSAHALPLTHHMCCRAVESPLLSLVLFPLPVLEFCTMPVVPMTTVNCATHLVLPSSLPLLSLPVVSKVLLYASCSFLRSFDQRPAHFPGPNPIFLPLTHQMPINLSFDSRTWAPANQGGFRILAR